MALKTKHGGAWHDTKNLFAKVGGNWRNVKGSWIKVGGVWKRTFSGNMDAWFSPYLQDPDRINGYYAVEDNDTHLLAEISGYTGGEANTMAVGWTIINLPVDKAVTVEFEVFKGNYPQNDGVILTTAGIVATFSNSTGRITRTFEGHGGWLNIILNFFCEYGYATTSYIKIYKVVVGDVQIYPAPA